MKEKAVSQELSHTTKAYHFTNVDEVINVTNDQLEDTFYIADDIFVPEKKNIARCYRSDFKLKTREEAQKTVNKNPVLISPKYKDTDFFVYNERTDELVPFKKNDYLIYEHGYFTFDGTDYISYDDNGHEIWKFSFADEHEPKAKKSKKKNTSK